jgi:hypothetical protein
MPFYLDKTRKNYFFLLKNVPKICGCQGVAKHFKDILKDKDLLDRNI